VSYIARNSVQMDVCRPKLRSVKSFHLQPLYHKQNFRSQSGNLAEADLHLWFVANERTFLSWMHMAITMGGITTALASFSVESENEAKSSPGSGPVTKRTTQAIVLMLLPISIGMIAYALFTFYWRSRCMERKQVSLCTSARQLCCKSLFGRKLFVAVYS